MRRSVRIGGATLAAVVCWGIGCGENARLLNPSFINYTSGGIVPLTPGPNSGFVLVRAINTTPLNIRFVVTAEHPSQIVGTNGVITTQIVPETVRLQTFPQASANEMGILFNCPVSRVGLGENIDFPSTQPGLFLGAVPGGVEGFGVPGSVNPLDADAGNFSCGDTLIFQASPENGRVGNVRVDSFVLSAADQPAQVSGPDTFNNARTVIEEFAFTE